MTSHWHDPTAPTQNSGNRLGTRPCVKLSESYMKQFSGDAAASFTGGSPAERIPLHARYNPHRPNFDSPTAVATTAAVPIPRTTPVRAPRQSMSLDSPSLCTSRDQPPQRRHRASSYDMKPNPSCDRSFWCGSDCSRLLYGEDDDEEEEVGNTYVEKRSFQAATHRTHQIDPSREETTRPLAEEKKAVQEIAEQELANQDSFCEPKEYVEPWRFDMAALAPARPSVEEFLRQQLRSYGVAEEPVKSSSHLAGQYHQRVQLRQRAEDINKTGHGDIITWSQLG